MSLRKVTETSQRRRPGRDSAQRLCIEPAPDLTSDTDQDHSQQQEDDRDRQDPEPRRMGPKPAADFYLKGVAPRAAL